MTRVAALAWIGDNALNAIAYVSLSVMPPMRARIWVRRAGSFYPPLETIEQARAVSRRLGNRGTCLSRAFAVASRCAASHVVIGVVPRKRVTSLRGIRARAIEAHAWVEVGGFTIDEIDDSPWVEVGRLEWVRIPRPTFGVAFLHKLKNVSCEKRLSK